MTSEIFPENRLGGEETAESEFLTFSDELFTSNKFSSDSDVEVVRSPKRKSNISECEILHLFL